MRIGVIGAGAMGSLFASHLVRGGARVIVYDLWREHIDAIHRNGLIVRRTGADNVVPIEAASEAAAIGACDVVLVMVKFTQTSAAIAGAQAMIGPSTLVITLQNGLGNVELIQSVLPANPIAFGLTTLTSELRGPGRIEASYAGRGETWLWPLYGMPSPQLDALCGILTASGTDAMLAPDIELRIWKKLIVNCCLNTVCAILGLPVGPVADRPESWLLLNGILRETVAVARAKGINLDEASSLAFLREVAEQARHHEPSMLIDVRHGRQTEIECLNGAVLRHAERLGISAPFNAAVCSIIRTLEGTYDLRASTADA